MGAALLGVKKTTIKSFKIYLSSHTFLACWGIGRTLSVPALKQLRILSRYEQLRKLKVLVLPKKGILKTNILF